MHTKPDLRVFWKWMIARSGSVITDVMRLEPKSFNELLHEQYATSSEPAQQAAV